MDSIATGRQDFYILHGMRTSQVWTEVDLPLIIGWEPEVLVRCKSSN